MDRGRARLAQVAASFAGEAAGVRRAHRRLPTRGEFTDLCRPDLAGMVGEIRAAAMDITLDHAVSALLDRAEYLDEKRTLKMAAEQLEQQGISEERKFQRERWARGVSVETTHVDGSIQDHADEIFDRMSEMGLGTQKKSTLSFVTPFPSINEAVMSDQERCFAVVGPPNNFKTSVLLSQAYYLAKQGKPVLFVTGEHEVEKLEEKITLLHGFFHRDKFGLPAYKKWADGKATEADVANLRAVMDDWKNLTGVPGPLVIKHIQDFGNNLERIVAWMESTHRKYGWKALVIDPFMELLLNVEDKEKFSVGGGLCQKLLALKTGYRNGEGLIVATSLQMKKAVKGKVAELNRDPGATLADYERVLEASEIERYSGAVQRFDMLWGVAQADERGRRGVIVCSRTRHGAGFEPFYFHVDPASHFCFEEPTAGAGSRRGEIDRGDSIGGKMGAKTKDPAEYSLPWFKFWANRWLGSETVSGMSLAEQGLFVRILCAQRVYGPLPRDAWKLSKMLGIRYEATTRWLRKYSALTADSEQSSSKFVVPKMEELQSILKKSTPDRAGDEKRRDENSPYSPPQGDELAGMEDCTRCLGEGRVPVFEDRDGVRMPVGYRTCDCLAEE